MSRLNRIDLVARWGPWEMNAKGQKLNRTLRVGQVVIAEISRISATEWHVFLSGEYIGWRYPSYNAATRDINRLLSTEAV